MPGSTSDTSSPPLQSLKGRQWIPTVGVVAWDEVPPFSFQIYLGSKHRIALFFFLLQTNNKTHPEVSAHMILKLTFPSLLDSVPSKRLFSFLYWKKKYAWMRHRDLKCCKNKTELTMFFFLLCCISFLYSSNVTPSTWLSDLLFPSPFSTSQCWEHFKQLSHMSPSFRRASLLTAQLGQSLKGGFSSISFCEPTFHPLHYNRVNVTFPPVEQALSFFKTTFRMLLPTDVLGLFLSSLYISGSFLALF